MSDSTHNILNTSKDRLQNAFDKLEQALVDLKKHHQASVKKLKNKILTLENDNQKLLQAIKEINKCLSTKTKQKIK